MRFFCKIFGHTEGTTTVFPDGLLRCTSGKCWRCGEEVPKYLRSEFLTLYRVRWFSR